AATAPGYGVRRSGPGDRPGVSVAPPRGPVRAAPDAGGAARARGVVRPGGAAGRAGHDRRGGSRRGQRRAGRGPDRAAAGLVEVLAQLLAQPRAAQLGQGLGLDLADALAAHPQLLGDLAERAVL